MFCYLGELSTFKHLIPEEGIYIISTNVRKHPIYVGASSRLYNRLGDHLRAGRESHLAEQPLHQSITLSKGAYMYWRVEALSLTDGNKKFGLKCQNIWALESALIARLLPRLNVAGKPIQQNFELSDAQKYIKQFRFRHIHKMPTRPNGQLPWND